MLPVDVVWVHFKLNSFSDNSIHVPGFGDKSLVSCSLILWSCFILCSATADLKSGICLPLQLCSLRREMFKIMLILLLALT
jgi:hypothetical protein